MAKKCKYCGDMLELKQFCNCQFVETHPEMGVTMNKKLNEFWNDYSESMMSVTVPIEAISNVSERQLVVGRYERIATDIGRLVDDKNEAYGDSFRQSEAFLRLLYPSRIPLESYKDVLALIRVWDKMKRIATHADAFGGNPWRDIAGYAILQSNDTKVNQVEQETTKSTTISR